MAERTVKLQETNARLESANTDLEAFILSVTHELRAPLRAVRGYAGLLKGNTTAPDAVLIDHIIDRTEHMSSMINNLLRLSRISRSGELSLQTVDLDAMVRKVAGTLQRDYPNARVSIAPLPTVTCDAGLMEQALENLVDNALKYSSRVATPQISIGVEDHAGERAFFVRDNGAGFDTQRARTLFGVFQRFHAESEFSGTGVGLAIVKRILERHHGRIWAQSQPDQGVTFWFTLGMPPLPDPRRPS